MNLNWYRCEGEIWCELNKIDINHGTLDGLEGVFVIWCGDKQRNVIRIGEGKIRKQLELCRKDITVQAFSAHGLYVTWAAISENDRNGVVKYLTKKLNPKFDSPATQGFSSKVNLPW